MTDNLTPEQRDDLRHMVGAQSHISKRDWGFRNYFNASKGSPDENNMQELERLGFVVAGRPGYWHCTEAGCAAAGLTAAQTRKALHGD